MPIKTLESYLFERKLANALSIEILQNATVGIDVDHYLSRIYTFKKEQFLAGIGGIPALLKDYIHLDLQVFQEFNIKPIFIINGLGFPGQRHQYKTNELSPTEQHLEAMWAKLGLKPMYQYNLLESFRIFTDPLPLRPMIHDLVQYFIEIGIDYLISPYDASFQLLYLYQLGMIDAIYGLTDLLLTKIDKFILGMEFQLKDFRFIDKQKVLLELQLTERQFTDLSLMVGCTVQPETFPNFPPLPKPNQIQPFPQLLYFKLGLDIIYHNSFVNQLGDLHAYIALLNDPSLLQLYYQGHAALNFAPVLNKEGYVEPYLVELLKLGLPINPDFLTKDDSGDAIVKIPNNTHEVINERLPPEFYFYQLLGIVPLELAEAITQGFLEIRPTLELGLLDSYKKLITSKFYVDNLDQQFNLLTQLLARYYQVKKVQVKYWFQDDIVELNNRMTPSTLKRIGLHYAIIKGEPDRFSLVDYFKIGTTKPDGAVWKPAAVIATVVYRTLLMFDLIDANSGELKQLGKVIVRFVTENDVSEQAFQELFLVLLLMKLGALVLTELNRNFTNVPKYFKEGGSELAAVELGPEHMKFLTIIGRVFSIHKLNISPINYQGPISRNLLNFRSHIKFISSALCNTLQLVLVDFLVHSTEVKHEYKGKDDWYPLLSQIPFYRDVNSTLLGVVAEIYFEYLFRQLKVGNKLSSEIKAMSHDHLMTQVFQTNMSLFNINVHGVNLITLDQMARDFAEGVKFWKLFIKLAQLIHATDDNLVGAQYLKDIMGADEWVNQFT